MISVSSYSLPEKTKTTPRYCVEDSLEIDGNKPELKSTYINQKREM